MESAMVRTLWGGRAPYGREVGNPMGSEVWEGVWVGVDGYTLTHLLNQCGWSIRKGDGLGQSDGMFGKMSEGK